MDTLHVWNEKLMAFNLFRFGVLNDQTTLETVRGMELLKIQELHLDACTVDHICTFRFPFLFYFETYTRVREN